VASEPPDAAHRGRARRRALARLLPGRAGLSSPRARARAAALAALALVVASIVAAVFGPGPGGPARVAVDTGAPGRAVPSSFLGLSLEWSSVAPFGGPGRAGIVRLLRRLEAARGAPLALRIGGASGDETWWDPSGRRPRPPTIRHAAGPATLDAIAALSEGLRAPVTLALDLQLNDPGNALALARAAERRLGPRLDALEVGNEPDLYTRARPFGPVEVRRLRKRVRYTPADYVRDAGRYLDALSAGLAGPRRPRLVVGGFAGSAAFNASLPALIGAHRAQVGGVAAHRYGLAACALHPDAADLRGRLLDVGTAHARLEGLAPLLRLAHARRLPLRIAELNSAPCGGAPGVSDTFAAALWLTDALFELVRLGADGADIHTFDGAVYAPFARRGSAVTPRAPFYGMLAFARAAPRGSRLVPVRVADAGPVRAWATVARDGTVRIALIAAARAKRLRVRVAVGDRRTCATAAVTSAPSVAARDGIADRPPRPACPRGRVLGLTLPGPSLTVVTLPAR
jgi:hypothetical protein